MRTLLAVSLVFVLSDSVILRVVGRGVRLSEKTVRGLDDSECKINVGFIYKFLSLSLATVVTVRELGDRSTQQLP